MTRGGYVFYELLAHFFYTLLHIMLALQLGTKQILDILSLIKLKTKELAY